MKKAESKLFLEEEELWIDLKDIQSFEIAHGISDDTKIAEVVAKIREAVPDSILVKIRHMTVNRINSLNVLRD